MDNILKYNMEILKVFYGKVEAPADGEWITLPIEKEELDRIINKYSKSEMIISDYESDVLHGFKVSELDSLTKWNEVCWEISDNGDMEAVAIAEAEYGDLQSLIYALEHEDNFTVYLNQTLEDLAWDFIMERYGKDFPYYYFDFEAFARDLNCEGYIETSYGVVYRG